MIEEHLFVREMLCKLLARNGIEARVFDHAAACLSATATEEPDSVLAILADLRYSNRLFPEETEALCRRFGDLPWMLTSHVPQAHLLQKPLMLSKPFAPAKIEAMLASLKSRRM